MIRVTDQYFWNVVFLVFFIILVVLASIILESESRIPLLDLSIVDYVLITLATWRLTRLFVYDSVTKFFREQFMDVVKAGRGYRLEAPKTGPRRTLHDLLHSPASFGLWAAAMLTFFYLLSSYMIFPMVLLSIAAVATFFSDLTKLVTTKGEK